MDFVNTVHDRHADRREDYLVTPQRYRAWCIRAGLLTSAEGRKLASIGGGDTLMHDAENFRESLYAVFCARIDGTQAPKQALHHLNKWVHRAWEELDVDCGGRLNWRSTSLDARLPLKRLALSTLEVLQQGAPERLKRCATEVGCGWLFYDETKNNRRQWCSMQTCGTVAKMKRYRARAA
ncbi:MAG TPA: CGNR zinc finger domain-containing protein [Aestuariivirga sp.]|nr:CGNR zinc finger domain-containing protein [Aestuariivirga sp.]